VDVYYVFVFTVCFVFTSLMSVFCCKWLCK